MRNEYMANKVEEIQTKIDDMYLTYDSKLLAAVMMVRAGQLLRGLYSIGAASDAEINAMIDEAFKDSTTKLPADKTPRTVAIGMPEKAS